MSESLPKQADRHRAPMTGQPMLGKTCRWCGAPATETITLEPTRYRSVTRRDPVSGENIKAQEVAQFAIVADVCEQHATVADREGGTPIPDPRRRKAQGVEQTCIFDMPGVEDDRRRNAIYGDAA